MRRTLIRGRVLFPLVLTLATVGMLWWVLSARAATTWYIATTGSALNAGTIGSPWTLAHWLSHPGAVLPGDTGLVRGGTYAGCFTSNLTGTPGARIATHNYTGENVKIDGNVAPASCSNGTALTIDGHYSTFRRNPDGTGQFEITNSSTVRGVYPQPDSFACGRTSGIVVNGQFTVIDRLIIHEMGQGLVAQSGQITDKGKGTVAFGNVLYFQGCGRFQHDFYWANQNTGSPSNGRKFLVGNISLQPTGNSLQFHGSSDSFLNGLVADDNIFAMGGYLRSPVAPARGAILGGGAPATNVTFTDTDVYFPADSSAGVALNLGDSAGITDPVVTGNYLRGEMNWNTISGTFTVTGNRFWTDYVYPMPIGNLTNAQTNYPQGGSNNGWFTAYTTPQNPSGDLCRIKSLAPQTINGTQVGETGRAHIAVWNYSGAATVSCDVSSVLTNGSSYTLQNAENFFGTAIMSGTYGGGSLAIPMTTGIVVAVPVGIWTDVNGVPLASEAPASTRPTFGAFVLITTAEVATPTPTGTVTHTPTVTLTNTPTRTPTQTFTGQPTNTPTRTPTTTPSPIPGAKYYVEFEAESGTLVSPMVTSTDALACGASRVSSNVGDTDADDSPPSGTVLFTKDIPVAGTANVWVRVLAVDPASDSVFTSIDGESDTFRIFDMAEGAWSSSWQWVLLTDRSLGAPGTIRQPVFSAGSHTLRFRGRDPNSFIDRVVITNNFSFTPNSCSDVTPTPTSTPTSVNTATITPTASNTPTGTLTPSATRTVTPPPGQASTTHIDYFCGVRVRVLHSYPISISPPHRIACPTYP